MSHIFISHVEEDYATVADLASRLESAGYPTWFYERDSAAGASYLVQTREAIVAAQAVALIISPNSLSSHQISKEVVRAHETHKPFIPLLLNMTDAEYKRRQPEWEEAVGAATSLAIPPEGVATILPRVLRGLEQMNVKRSGQPVLSAATLSPGPQSVSERPPLPSNLRHPATPTTPSRSVPGRVVVGGIIGAFTLITGLGNLLNALNPVSGGNEALLYQAFPAVQIANIFANGVNASLSTVVLFGCWLVYRSRAKGNRIVRVAAAAMLGVIVLWVAWVLIGATSGPNWANLPGPERSAMLGGTIVFGSFALLLAGTVFLLFRTPD